MCQINAFSNYTPNTNEAHSRFFELLGTQVSNIECSVSVGGTALVRTIWPMNELADSIKPWCMIASYDSIALSVRCFVVSRGRGSAPWSAPQTWLCSHRKLFAGFEVCGGGGRQRCESVTVALLAKRSCRLGCHLHSTCVSHWDKWGYNYSDLIYR